MKTNRPHFRWLALYLLIALIIVVLFWEENLKISLLSHEFLAGGIVVVFGFLILDLINHHQTNFMSLQEKEPRARQQDTPEKQNKSHLER